MTTPDYEAMTVDQLKALCSERSLTTGGTKAELVERLAADDAANAEPPAPVAPGTGDLVTTGTGDYLRVGIIVGPGRTPDPTKGESPEPLVIWLTGTPSPFGGELTAVS